MISLILTYLLFFGFAFIASYTIRLHFRVINIERGMNDLHATMMRDYYEAEWPRSITELTQGRSDEHQGNARTAAG